MVVKGDFSALKKLASKIAGMSLRHQDAVLMKGMDTATKSIADAARNNAPKDEGDLKASMTNVVRSYKGGNLIMGFVGPEKGFYRGGKGGKRVRIRREKGESTSEYQDRNAGQKRPENYAHLVEFGHHSAAGQGKHFTDGTKGTSIRKKTFPIRSFTPGKPFLRPAFEQGRANLEQELGNATGEAMQKEFDKLST
jgi:HK97 gp10 family phage protein